MCVAPGNRIVAWAGKKHPQQTSLPILYLDEKAMVWRELDRHISEVGKDA